MCSVLAVMAVTLSGIAEVRRQLSTTNARLMELSRETESRIEDLSLDMNDQSAGLRKEIASTQRNTRGDVSRIGRLLSGRLDQMSRQMKDQDAAAQARVASQTSLAQIPASSGPAPAAANNVPTAPQASAEQDLSAARKMKEGMTLYKSGKYGQAQKSFLAVVAAQPENVNARLYYAASLYRANPSDATGYPLIEKNLRLVLRSDGESPLALETLAMVEVERRKWPEALDHLRLIIAQQPSNTGYLKTAGHCALRTGEVLTAREYFEAASRRSPNDKEALDSLGDCESSLGNAEKAEEAWEAALSAIDEGTSSGAREILELHLKLARSAYERGAFAESLAYAREGGHERKSLLLRAYEGLSLTAVGNTDDGIPILREVSLSSDVQAAGLAQKGLQEGKQ